MAVQGSGWTHTERMGEIQAFYHLFEAFHAWINGLHHAASRRGYVDTDAGVHLKQNVLIKSMSSVTGTVEMNTIIIGNQKQQQDDDESQLLQDKLNLSFSKPNAVW
ncbi:unnamed protein product, partial [Didymodactylos carnosus]